MPKMYIPHVHHASEALAMIYPSEPDVGQIKFVVGDEWHIFPMSRKDLRQLAQSIEQALKEAPSPSESP